MSGPSPEITFRRLRPGEEKRACAVARAAFRAFVATGFSLRGRASFRSYARPAAMAARRRSGHVTLVAETSGRFVGVLEIRRPAHIAMLFVDGRFQRRGVARRLLREARVVLARDRPGPPPLTVHAAPNAVPAYERLGFTPTGPEQIERGVRYVPMRETDDDGS